MTTRLRGSRKYPSIPAISDDPKSHTPVLRAVTEALQIHERRTGDIESSFVRISDLVEMGIIEVVNGNFNVVLPQEGAASASDATIIDREMSFFLGR